MAREKRAGWFKVSYSLRAAVEVLDDAEVGAAFRAALRLFDGEAVDESVLPGMGLVLYAMLRGAVEESLENYEAAVQAGGRRRRGPQGASGGLTPPEGASRSLTEENRKEENRKEKKRREKECGAAKPPAPASFPPSIEDVRAFAEERKSTVDPQRFYDYFDAGAWLGRDGKELKNWKQVLISWEREENTHGRAELDTAGATGEDASRGVEWRIPNELGRT